MMTKKEKFLWGGVGAIVPLLLTFLDASMQVVTSATFGTVIFYFIRGLIYFLLGGITTFFEKTEDVWPLIRMGIAAPLLFAGLVSNNAAQKVSFNIDAGLINAAYAGEPTPSKDDTVRDFKDEEAGLKDVVTQAVIGETQPSKYLIIGERDDLFAARDFAQSVKSELEKKGLLADSKLKVNLFIPYKDLKYTVVLSDRLNHQEADELVKLLLLKDFKGVRVWDLKQAAYVEK